jgi:hypothetical protein
VLHVNTFPAEARNPARKIISNEILVRSCNRVRFTFILQTVSRCTANLQQSRLCCLLHAGFLCGLLSTLKVEIDRFLRN